MNAVGLNPPPVLTPSVNNNNNNNTDTAPPATDNTSDTAPPADTAAATREVSGEPGGMDRQTSDAIVARAGVVPVEEAPPPEDTSATEDTPPPPGPAAAAAPAQDPATPEQTGPTLEVASSVAGDNGDVTTTNPNGTVTTVSPLPDAEPAAPAAQPPRVSFGFNEVTLTGQQTPEQRERDRQLIGTAMGLTGEALQNFQLNGDYSYSVQARNVEDPDAPITMSAVVSAEQAAQLEASFNSQFAGQTITLGQADSNNQVTLPGAVANPGHNGVSTVTDASGNVLVSSTLGYEDLFDENGMLRETITGFNVRDALSANPTLNVYDRNGQLVDQVASGSTPFGTRLVQPDGSGSYNVVDVIQLQDDRGGDRWVRLRNAQDGQISILAGTMANGALLTVADYNRNLDYLRGLRDQANNTYR